MLGHCFKWIATHGSELREWQAGISLGQKGPARVWDWLHVPQQNSHMPSSSLQLIFLLSPQACRTLFRERAAVGCGWLSLGLWQWCCQREGGGHRRVVCPEFLAVLHIRY